MQGDTIFFNRPINLESLKSAYSKLLGIPLDTILILHVMRPILPDNFDTYRLYIEYYTFKEGDFIFELQHVISKTTRNNSFESNCKIYRNLAEELDVNILVPGDYADLSNSFELIFEPGKEDIIATTTEPEEYGDKGVCINKIL